MKIIAVDDEEVLLARLVDEIRKNIPGAEVSGFTDCDEVFEYIPDNEVEIAFLDIELGSMSGIELAKRIKRIHPCCNIIFCTGFTEYAPDAFRISASDYLMKPVTAEKIRHAMENLRHPLTLKIPDGILYARCFGSFELFFNGETVKGLTKRSKELLAFLIDRRGAECSAREVTSILFDQMSDVNFRIACKDLSVVLESLGQGEVLIKKWGRISVNMNAMICDYNEYINGNPAAINLYKGEYMTQYAWAEKTTTRLNKSTESGDYYTE